VKRLSTEEMAEKKRLREDSVKNFIKTDKRRGSFLAAIPKGFQWLFYQVYAGKIKSPTKAIRAKCIDCSCWQRDEVEKCMAVTCPLYDFRPYQEKDKPFKQDTPLEETKDL